MSGVTEIKSSRKSLFFITGSVISLSILLLLFIPTLIWLLFNGPSSFFSQQIYSQKSPDNKFEIKVFSKVNFPASEIIDPSITVDVSLNDVQEKRQLNAVRFELYEISDLENPEIAWTPTEVQINRIDHHKNFSINFRLPAKQD